MERLKIYSIKNTLLSEKITNWDLLFIETKQILRNYLEKVSKWHNFDYLAEDEPMDHLPYDCYSEFFWEIISLWYPFYYELYRGFQEEIENDVKQILFEIKMN